MNRDTFILVLAVLLAKQNVPEAVYEAARFVIDNPSIETETSPQLAADEWLSAAGDALDWRDPAR